MRDPLRNIPVRYKLALTFAGVCVIAFGLGGYLVSNSSMTALEHEVMARLNLQSQAYATALEGDLDSLRLRARDFASDGFIRSRFEDWQSSHAATTEEELRSHLLQNKLPIVDAFRDLALVSPAGEVFHVLAGGTAWTDAALADLPSSSEKADANTDWLMAADGYPTLALSTPLWSLDGERVIGSLLAHVHPGVWVRSSMARIGGQNDAQAPTLALTDRMGASLEIPPHLMDAPLPESGSDLVLSGFGLSLSSAPEEPQLRGTFIRTIPFSSNGWTVRARLEARAAMAVVSGLQARFVALSLVLTLGTALLLIFPMRYLARPLSQLRDAASHVHDGDFSRRVPVTSRDEIGELARTFNLMTEAVEERTSKLETSAADLARRKNELRDERDRLNAVISSMRDGLVVLNADGEPEVWNAAARPLLGMINKHEFEPTSHHTCEERSNAGPQDPNPCVECLFTPAAPPRSCLIDVGSQVFEVHSTRLTTNAGGRSGRVLVSRDLTERIDGDEREIHQERLAVLGEVAAVVAHEINNPLAAITMFNQMLGKELSADSSLQECVEVIGRSAETCKHAIRELLDYATGASPEINTVDVHATLEDVARFLRTLAKRHQVEITLDLCAPVAVVKCDEVQLRQVFVNLIMNAVQAAGEDGGEVNVRTENEGDHVTVLVSDDGPGIPDEKAGEIFKPFFTTKARGQGTGLGLPTARRITEMQGGGLELVDTAPGRTTFQVRLLSRVS